MQDTQYIENVTTIAIFLFIFRLNANMTPNVCVEISAIDVTLK